MKRLIILLPVCLLWACANETQECEEHVAPEEHGQHADGEHHGPHGDANAYMHETSVDELVERFEAPERDQYQRPDKVLAWLGDLKGKKIMDLGAGTGYFSVKMADKGAEVIAADVDVDFQEYLKERIIKNGLKNIELRKIPYDDPELKKEEVDIVLVVDTYHHIEERVNYFKKVKAGTKPNGELVIIDFYKAETPFGPPVNHKISMDEVISELKKAGYTHFEVEVNLLPYQYLIRAK